MSARGIFWLAYFTGVIVGFFLLGQCIFNAANAQTVTPPSSPGMNSCLTKANITTCTDGTVVIQNDRSTFISRPDTPLPPSPWPAIQSPLLPVLQ